MYQEEYSSPFSSKKELTLQKQVHAFFDEIQSIQQKEKENQEKVKKNLFTYGIILTIIGGLSFLASLGILSGESATISTVGFIISALALITYKQIFQSNGLKKIKEKIYSFFSSITKSFKRISFSKRQNSDTLQTETEDFEKTISFYFKRPRPRIFGVCALLSEISGTDVSVIRAAFILGLIFSGGWMIVAYIMLAFMKPFLEKEALKAAKERYKKHLENY